MEEHIKTKISYATLLYSRNEIKTAVQDCSRAKYHGMEVSLAFFGTGKEDFKKNTDYMQTLLNEARLKISCIMIGWLDESRILERVAIASEIANNLNVGVVGILPPRRSRMNWTNFVAILEEACDITEKYSLDLAVHHHGGCIVERPKEIGEMLKEVPQSKLLFDIGHYFPFGDPVKGIRRFKDAIAYVHLKDIAPPKNFDLILREILNNPHDKDAMKIYGNAFCDLGNGVIDLEKVLRELLKFYHGWLTIEVDNLRMPRKEHARCNMRYLKQILKTI